MKNELTNTQATNVSSMIIELSKRDDIDPSKIEKLLELQITMENRQAEQAFHRAMALFQGECPVIPRNKKTDFDSKSGGKVKYDYAPLDQIVALIKPILSKHGLSFSFSLAPQEGAVTKLIVTISHLEGHSKNFEYFFDTIHDDGRMNLSQRRKSALTYAKRAGLENALGLVTTGEDDDASRAIDSTISDEQLKIIENLIKTTATDSKRFLAYLKVEKLEDLSSYEAKKAINALKQKRASHV